MFKKVELTKKYDLTHRLNVLCHKDEINAAKPKLSYAKKGADNCPENETKSFRINIKDPAIKACQTVCG